MNVPHALPTLGPGARAECQDEPNSGLGRKLALVIPTLGEAANVQVLLDRLAKSLQPLAIPYELIVVDDDSQDGIERLVTKIAQADERVRLLVRKGVRGLAGAVIHGWANSDADVLGVMDADLQHPPELVPDLWHALESNDLVVASRYAPEGRRNNWNRFSPSDFADFDMDDAAAATAVHPSARSDVRLLPGSEKCDPRYPTSYAGIQDPAGDSCSWRYSFG
jgi:glycosyltransferase involved in cell wall biosynthesis